MSSDYKLVKSRFDDLPEAPLHDPSHVYKKFNADNSTEKFNLKNIRYKDDDGTTWSPPLIERIKLMLATDDCLKNRYLPRLGLSMFNDVTAKLMLGKTSTAILENKIINIHTPSNICSIKVASTFLLEYLHYKTFYLSTPYDEEVRRIVEYAGFKDIRYYTYWCDELYRIDFDSLKNDLDFAPTDSIIFLYVNAHSPTCYDLTMNQWDELSDIIKAHKLYPLFYSCNLGICSGNISEDAYCVRLFVKKNIEFMCVQDFESLFCMYSERASTLMLYTLDSNTLINLEWSLAQIATALYNSPNVQAARIITYVFNCSQFYLIWESYIKTMAERIIKMRKLLRMTLELLNAPGNWSILTQQRGIYAYIPLSYNQINCLMEVHHIYMNNMGRLNITGINTNNVDYISKAIADTIINVQ